MPIESAFVEAGTAGFLRRCSRATVANIRRGEEFFAERALEVLAKGGAKGQLAEFAKVAGSAKAVAKIANGAVVLVVARDAFAVF